MSIREFRDLGYLKELNRNFLHPLGLALAIREENDGEFSLDSIVDYRDDPEGMCYEESTLLADPGKARYVAEQVKARYKARVERLGFWIQPVPGVAPLFAAPPVAEA
jgi:hypothetical protein